MIGGTQKDWIRKEVLGNEEEGAGKVRVVRKVV